MGGKWYQDVDRPLTSYERHLRYRQKHPEKSARLRRSSSLKRRYGITIGEWEQLFEKQDKSCKICKSPTTKQYWHTDHCHTTNKVRGILCVNCNTALGQFQDDIQILKNAILYLEETRTNNG